MTAPPLPPSSKPLAQPSEATSPSNAVVTNPATLEVMQSSPWTMAATLEPARERDATARMLEETVPHVRVDGSASEADAVTALVPPTLGLGNGNAEVASGTAVSSQPSFSASSGPLVIACGGDEFEGRDLGPYHLIRRVGEGTMGRVYEAQHRGLARLCAIKIMNPDLARRQPWLVENFYEEARAAARLDHPHVVAVRNLGCERGVHFLELEYVPGGESLKQRVVVHGPQPPAKVACWGRQIALALAAAHRQGLVHRDVKPANVLVTPDEQVKLADFGLVRPLVKTEAPSAAGPVGARAVKRLAPGDVVRGGVGWTSPTAAARAARHHAVAGTPMFMAPELFRGKPATPASDAYALGVTLFYLATARLPFTASSVNRLIKLHLQAEPPDPRDLVPEINDDLAEVILRCLAKKPRHRIHDLQQLAERLQAIFFQYRDIHELVLQALEDMEGVVVQGGQGRYRLICPVPDDRIQEVYVETGHDAQGEPTLSVYSLCAPADPDHYGYALRLNAELSHGAISVRRVGGESMFVMARNHPLTRVAAADVAASIREIAHHADQVEARFSRMDLF